MGAQSDHGVIMIESTFNCVYNGDQAESGHHCIIDTPIEYLNQVITLKDLFGLGILGGWLAEFTFEGSGNSEPVYLPERAVQWSLQLYANIDDSTTGGFLQTKYLSADTVGWMYEEVIEDTTVEFGDGSPSQVISEVVALRPRGVFIDGVKYKVYYKPQ
jgi:hypothetical protein